MSDRVLVDTLVAIVARRDKRRAFAERTMTGEALELERHAADEEMRTYFEQLIATLP